jgi:hypothetical protein
LIRLAATPKACTIPSHAFGVAAKRMNTLPVPPIFPGVPAVAIYLENHL